MPDDKRLYVRIADWKADPHYVPGDDPDSYLHREGATAFKNLLASAKPYGDYLIDDLDRQLQDEPDVFVRALAVRNLVGDIMREPDPVVRAHWLKRVAEMWSIDEALLLTPIPVEPPHQEMRPPREVGPSWSKRFEK